MWCEYLGSQQCLSPLCKQTSEEMCLSMLDAAHLLLENWIKTLGCDLEHISQSELYLHSLILMHIQLYMK